MRRYEFVGSLSSKMKEERRGSMTVEEKKKIMQEYLDGLKDIISDGTIDWEKIRRNNLDWDYIQDGLMQAGVKISGEEARRLADEIWDWYETVKDEITLIKDEDTF